MPWKQFGMQRKYFSNCRAGIQGYIDFLKEVFLIETVEKAVEIAHLVAQYGGKTYFVGGFVRDKLRGVENKDIDIEVHGITAKKLESILDSVGERVEIGKSFGVYNLKGFSLDIAMPRAEKAIGQKHRDFCIDIDPFIGTKKAAVRRDFTMNAIMQDVLTEEITDHFGGMKDIKDSVIRCVNEKTFSEDPLRVLRAAQFAARFGFSIENSTKELCCKIDLSNLSQERVMEELKKAMLKSNTPSVFFENLRMLNQLKVWFPEMEKLVDLKQNPTYHAEGDVWKHTMMVIDAAAKFRDKVKTPLGFMLSALVHDFGKIVCTKTENGKIHSRNHEVLGLPLVEKFLKRITKEKELISYVLNMAKLHMKPNIMARDNSTVKATNRMFDEAREPEDLIYLAVCDGLGKISEIPYNSAEKFLLDRLGIYREYMSRDYVTGKDLICAGIAPGDEFKNLLEYAHKLRLSGVGKEEALRQVLACKRKKD